MPPKGRGERLSEEEVALLREWIRQGAKFDKHWSYKPLVREEVPQSVHPVDHFIDRRLAEEGLALSPMADRRTLARRVSLDLIGLPPTPEDLNAFLADKSPNAYGNYVDRLMAGPEFGEHWARMWLDLARYADSAGYADDRPGPSGPIGITSSGPSTTTCPSTSSASNNWRAICCPSLPRVNWWPRPFIEIPKPTTRAEPLTRSSATWRWRTG